MRRGPALEGRRRRIAERIETAVIVGPATLILIKGWEAISGVVSGVGQMVAAVFRW